MNKLSEKHQNSSKFVLACPGFPFYGYKLTWKWSCFASLQQVSYFYDTSVFFYTAILFVWIQVQKSCGGNHALGIFRYTCIIVCCCAWASPVHLALALTYLDPLFHLSGNGMTHTCMVSLYNFKNKIIGLQNQLLLVFSQKPLSYKPRERTRVFVGKNQTIYI